MKKTDLLLVFLITLIPRLVVSLYAYPLVYVSDETSTISVAALVAGFDWSEVVSHAGYYGIGYSFLFAPLFYIIKNPIWIYRSILIVSSVIVALSAPICYVILYKYFYVKDRGSQIIIAVLCGALNLFTSINITIRNEEILYLIIWIIVYVLCDILHKNNSNEDYKMKEIILLFLLGYTLTLHTRAICLIIGIIFIDIIYRIINKNGIIHKWSYLAFIIIYFISNIGLKLYQSKIWENGTKNTSVLTNVRNSLSKVSSIFDANLYLNIIRIVFGQIYTAGAVSGGLFIIAVFILIYYFMEKSYKKDNMCNLIFVISGIFLFCTVITICGMSVTWSPGVADGIEKYGEGVYRSVYRAFSYLRYMGCYVPPFVMCAFIIAEKDKKILKKAVMSETVIMCILTLFWMKCILPYVYNNKSSYYATLGNMKANERVTYQNWYLACFWVQGIVIAGLLLCYMKKEKIYIVLVIVVMIYERLYSFGQVTLIVLLTS